MGPPSKRVTLGIGDDAAVLQSPKGNLVATVDTLVEGVHFDLTYSSPQELGHKALAVNLSDIAAMGAEPLYALVSLGLKQEMSEIFVTEIYQGMKKLAKRFSVDIVGGNIAQSPSALIIDVIALGQVGEKYAKRSGAMVGDVVAVTGYLGRSAAGLAWIRRIGRHGEKIPVEILKAHLTPEPRVKESLALMKTGGVGAMIDISDGLARELHHIANQSKMGILIDQSLLPISKATLDAATYVASDAQAWALFGGEDYELLLTLNPKTVKAAQKALAKLGTPLTVIGEVVPKKEGVRIKSLSGEMNRLEAKGWNHFVRRRRV